MSAPGVKKPQREISRKVHFLMTEVRPIAEGASVPSQDLPFVGTANWPGAARTREVDGRKTKVRVDKVRPAFTTGTLRFLRRDDLPTAEDEDEVEDRLPLEDDQMLSEACHWLWADFSQCKQHPETPIPARFGVLLCEHNHRGPRWRDLVQHLQELFKDQCKLEASPIVEPSGWNEVMSADGLGRIEAVFRRRRDRKTHLLPGWDVSELQAVSNESTGSITLGIGPVRRNRFSPMLVKDQLKLWLGSPYITHLRVDVGRPSGALDLVENLMKKKTTVAPQDEYMRAVNRTEMFRALIKLHQQERGNIAEAMGYRWVPPSDPDPELPDDLKS